MRDVSDKGAIAPAQQPRSVEDLQAALEEERLRTREADHRAKNTLQLISSLLFLLSRRSANEETRRAMMAMHQRVNALTAVHRDLLAAARSGGFDLTQLVREETTALAQANGEGAAVRLELEPVEVEPAAAGPLALILNELVLNALAHARIGERAPTVTVSLRRKGAGFSLAVQDDGPGPMAAETPGFGLMIVQLLARQLAASFELEDAHPGLRAVVTTA